MFENIGPGRRAWAGSMQSGSSSRSGRNRGAAVGGGGKRGAAVPQSGPGAAAEAHASGEQHAAEADAIGEKQLFRAVRSLEPRLGSRLSCPAPDYAR